MSKESQEMRVFTHYFIQYGKHRTDMEIAEATGLDIDTVTACRVRYQYREWKKTQERIKKRLGFL